MPEAILEYFEQVAALLFGDRGQPPVVDDQDVDAGKFGEQSDIAAVGPREGQLTEEARGTAVEGREALATSLLGKRAGDESLSSAIVMPLS